MTQTPSEADKRFKRYSADTGTSANAYAVAATYETGPGSGTIYVTNTGSSTYDLRVKFTDYNDQIIQFLGSDETDISDSDSITFNYDSKAVGNSEVNINVKSAASGSPTTYSVSSEWRKDV